MKRLVELAKDIARQRPWLAGVVIAIAVVGFAAAVYLVSPLFIRYSVVEESPLGDIGEATVAKDEPMADATVAAEATMAKAASMKMPTVVETPMGEEMETGPTGARSRRVQRDSTWSTRAAAKRSSPTIG